ADYAHRHRGRPPVRHPGRRAHRRGRRGHQDHCLRYWAEGGNVTMAPTQKIRIRLRAFEHGILDQSAERIVDTARRGGARVASPVPLPTERSVLTVRTAPNGEKDMREQFERRTHKRLIDILGPAPRAVDALMRLDSPAGVDSEIK